MKTERAMFQLYAITDRHWLKEGESLCSQVEAAIDGGVTCIQLREKQLTGHALRAEAKAVVDLCRSRGVPCLINDNVELAMEIGADGVHVGQSDMAADKARILLGPDKILGVTAHNVAEARKAEADGADYIGSGAVFATGTKADARPLSRHEAEEICRTVKIPVVAIGGITAENVETLGGIGFDGIATVSAIFGAEDIRKAAQILKNKVKEW